MPKLLTKSKYMLGLQCPKCMWIAIHKPEQMPEPDIVASSLEQLAEELE